MAEIEKRFKELGLPPSEIRADGTPRYTVPAIYDASTDTKISDSLKIIEYLEQTYPNTPRILVPGTDVLNAAFDWGLRQAMSPLMPLIAPNVIRNLAQASSEMYRQRMEVITGTSVEALKDDKEMQEKLWATAEEAFKVPASWFMASNGEEGGPWIMGKDITIADVILAGTLAYIAIAVGEDSEEWKKIGNWNEGLWRALWERARPYLRIH